jgi:hypothetical protein
LIGVGSFFPDMLFMNQLGAHMEWINQGLWIQWKRYPFERRILLKTTTQIDQKCFAEAIHNRDLLLGLLHLIWLDLLLCDPIFTIPFVA